MDKHALHCMCQGISWHMWSDLYKTDPNHAITHQAKLVFFFDTANGLEVLVVNKKNSNVVF